MPSTLTTSLRSPRQRTLQDLENRLGLEHPAPSPSGDLTEQPRTLKAPNRLGGGRVTHAENAARARHGHARDRFRLEGHVGRSAGGGGMALPAADGVGR